MVLWLRIVACSIIKRDFAVEQKTGSVKEKKNKEQNC